MMKIYETNRLHLREIDESYAEKFFNITTEIVNFKKPGKSIDRMIFTLDYQKKKLQKDRKEIAEGKIIRLWIFKKGDDTKIIGCISFNLIVRGIYQSCVLGYKLDKEELNKGYTTEALRKAIRCF